jgi:cation diffusion facilitator family transporter
MDQQSTYKKQARVSIFQFLTEVINFVVITVTAAMSGSLIMWADLINSTGNTLRTGLTARFSLKMTKDLKYQYNYGIGKAEAMISLFCDCFIFIGVVATMFFAVMDIIYPKEQEGMLLLALLVKLACVICDMVPLYLQYKVKKLDNNRVANSGFIATLGALMFDAAAFISIFVVWIARDTEHAKYLSPIFAILISIYMLVSCVKHMCESVFELTDRTLPEKEQMAILKVMTKHQHRFDGFGNIKTRRNGTKIDINIALSFSEGTSYAEIKALKDDLQNDLAESVENCIVTIEIE